LKSSFYGLSRIIRTTGNIITQAGSKEEMITATFDIDAINKEKKSMTTFKIESHIYTT